MVSLRTIINKITGRDLKDSYRIKKAVRHQKILYIPEVKPGGSRFSSWTRITKVYEKYYLTDITGEDSVLSIDECKAHIQGYKIQRALEKEMSIARIEFIPID